MNDEQIIQKGGGEREIEQYAEMNGADSMNQTLTQEQEAFDKVYFDRSQDGHPYAGDPMYDRLRKFLPQSNLRCYNEGHRKALEKTREMMEKLRQDVINKSGPNDTNETRLAELSLFSEIFALLSTLIEQK